MVEDSHKLKIDFVVPWVDGDDPKWMDEFVKHHPENKILNNQSRFKDWNNLQYIFRAFEYFTPWVNKIYFITWGHLPEWLDTTNEKLVIVKHEDYIPSEFLPVFSSHPIEINLHRIAELSEHFVYFNDDFFILKPIDKGEFFKFRKPVDFALMDVAHDGLISHIVMNDVDIINKSFNRHVKQEYSKLDIVKNNFKGWFNLQYGLSGIIQNLFLMKWKGHTGFVLNHHPQPYLKSVLETVWEREPDTLRLTSASKFRSNQDVNQYLFRFWQLVSGQFYPANYKVIKKNRKHVEVRTKFDAVNVAKLITSGELSFCCINDAIYKGRYTKEDMSQEEFEESKQIINTALASLLPQPCSFEKNMENCGI